MYPWLRRDWQTLLDVAHAGRLGHAWLLLGDEGLGKEQLADALAALHLCQHPTADGACGQCHACQLLDKSHHPDFNRIGREGKSIGVDPVREVCRRLNESAQLGLGKVLIVEQAERMTEAAANALLKTLEEPPGNSLIVLLTSQASRLLPTILSRCNKHHCLQPAEEVTLSWLQGQGIMATPSQVRLCQGAPLRVKAYLEEGSDAMRRTLLEAVVSLRREPTRLPEVASAMATDLEHTIPWLQLLINDVLKCQAGCGVSQLAMPDLDRQLHELAELCSCEQLLDSQRDLVALRERCQPGQLVNPSIHIQQWFSRWL